MSAKSTSPSLTPVRAAVIDEALTITYDGDPYVIPPSDDWPLDSVEAVESGRIMKGVELILGPEQWSAFRKKHQTLKGLRELFEIIQEEAGVPN